MCWLIHCLNNSLKVLDCNFHQNEALPDVTENIEVLKNKSRQKLVFEYMITIRFLKYYIAQELLEPLQKTVLKKSAVYESSGVRMVPIWLQIKSLSSLYLTVKD